VHLVTEKLKSKKVNTRNVESHMSGSHDNGRYDLHLLDDLRLPQSTVRAELLWKGVGSQNAHSVTHLSSLKGSIETRIT